MKQKLSEKQMETRLKNAHDLYLEGASRNKIAKVTHIGKENVQRLIRNFSSRDKERHRFAVRENAFKDRERAERQNKQRNRPDKVHPSNYRKDREITWIQDYSFFAKDDTKDYISSLYPEGLKRKRAGA